MIKAEELFQMKGIFYAHIRGDEKETLEAHSLLTEKYFEELAERRHLKEVLERLAKKVFGDLYKDEYPNIIYETIRDAVLLHDIGKINPAFQRNKMDNFCVEDGDYEGVSGSDHSLLSSVLYLDYELYKMKYEKGMETIHTLNSRKPSKFELFFVAFILLNAYVISRHHSDLGNLEEYFSKFDDRGDIKNIYRGLSEEKYPFTEWRVKRENFPNNLKSAYNIALKSLEIEQSLCFFVYTRLIYSLLVASDYYATTEFMEGLKMADYGDFDDILEFKKCYEESDIVRKIRKYENKKTDISEMNRLRNELFLETEQNLKSNLDKNIYFLEAPTGSGKSNIALNLGLNLAVKGQSKLFYVYPFNNLIEQNLEVLSNTFRDKLMDKITVVNSLTPIKNSKSEYSDEDELLNSKSEYSKLLLDRQFMNYPFVLTTHVSLFDIMFSNRKTNIFSFLQLVDSVIIMDEIQSYNIKIWTEIILFLHLYSDILNIRILIMSATLPDLGKLIEDSKVYKLIGDIATYFESPIFSKRVELNYDLLGQDYSEEMLYEHILKQGESKILVEFITKESAYDFYGYVKKRKTELDRIVLCMTGDDNIIERKRILEIVKKCDKKIILIATQVVEAGVDIDMDIGYKTISKLDSEEQFMGRINRSNCKSGKVYFFKATEPRKIYKGKIYKGDVRTNEKFIIENKDMREILEKKDFQKYYSLILDRVNEERNKCDDNNIDYFKEEVKRCEFLTVSKRMKLIDDDDRKQSIFFNREIKDLDGNKMFGREIWEEYKNLVFDTDMGYAEKMVKLSQVRAKLQYFIYDISKKYEVSGEKFGELIYVDNGEEFFENGKLNFEKFKGGAIFI